MHIIYYRVYYILIPLYYVDNLDTFVVLFSITIEQRNIEGIFCSYDEIATLVKLKLFPVTPSRPFLLVSHFLLDWMEATSLDCQIAIKDFVSAIDILHRNHRDVSDRRQ